MKDAVTVMQSMALMFRAGECSLPTQEAEALKQWVSSWRDSPEKFHVLIGGAHETSRAGRLRRLSLLTTLIEQYGTPKKRIHPDEDCLRPSRMGVLDDLPSDMVWLQLQMRSPASSLAAVTTERNCGVSINSRRE